MSHLVSSATLVVFGLAISSAQAHNTYFLPGDAFFHTRLSEEVAQSLAPGTVPTFHYGRPAACPGKFCGYAGFPSLTAVGMSDDTKLSLRSLYYELREASPKRTEAAYLKGEVLWTNESNAFHLLLYNASMDFERFEPFLKYNEEWVGETASFGHDRNHVELQRFVPDWDGREWRDATLVPALDVRAPLVPDSHNTSLIDEAVSAEHEMIAVLMSTDDFKRYQNRRPGALFYLVNGKSIVKYQYRRGHYWEPLPMEEQQ